MADSLAFLSGYAPGVTADPALPGWLAGWSVVCPGGSEPTSSMGRYLL
jgi:hypothetical protein